MLDDISINVADVEFRGSFLSEGVLPDFRGATLRGSLGYSLRNTVCNNLKRKCNDCFLVQNCAYSNFFEGVSPPDRDFMRLYPNTPQPFMLILKSQENGKISIGQSFSFGVNIFGSACNLFPYVAYAFFRAGEIGIGQDKLIYEIDEIVDSQEILFKKGSTLIKKPVPKPLKMEKNHNVSDIELDFITPVRIRKDSQTSFKVEMVDLIKASLRRISAINYFYGNGVAMDLEYVNKTIAIAESIKKQQDTTEYVYFDRFSGRQQRKVRLDGIIGKIRFEQVPIELVSIFRVIDQIGLGKATSFGLGRLKLNIL